MKRKEGGKVPYFKMKKLEWTEMKFRKNSPLSKKMLNSYQEI